MSKENYGEVARKLGIKHRIGKYGFTFFPRDPGGNIYRLFQIIPLDGWITDPKEVERVIRERGMEL